MPKLLPLLLAVYGYGSVAHAFEPVKFADGTVLDVSLHVSYTNMKRINGPRTIRDYNQPSSPTGVVNASAPIKGSFVSSAVDEFTQIEAKVNTDDGDNAVGKHGTISNRISALIDLNLTKDDYRAFIRINSFRDESLFKSNANGSAGTFNGLGPTNQYTDEARSLIGQRTRLLDAYVQGRWKLGEGGSHPLTVKVGRQVVNWGEGLFFQGIGSSMNANDQVKGQTPGVPAQEAFLPVEQIYSTLGVNDKLTLMAYKKFKFQETEQAPAGTYFSISDFVSPGGRFQTQIPWNNWPFLAGTPLTGTYGAYVGPEIGKTSKGQWGVGLKYQLTDKTDVGLYHLKYTESAGQPQFGFSHDHWKLGQGMVSSDIRSPNFDISAALLTGFNLFTPLPSSVNIRYMNNIKLTGASFSSMLGDYSVAGEVAYRSGAPIMLSNLYYDHAPGRVLNANLNALRAWSGGDFLNGITRANTVILGGELALQHLIGFDVPKYNVSPVQVGFPRGPAEIMFDRNALATVLRLELAYTPFPDWDLSIPIFYWRELVGNGAMQGPWNSGLWGKNSGRMSIETKFTYRQNLELGMSLNYCLGTDDRRFHTFNPVADRSFVAFNAGYHF